MKAEEGKISVEHGYQIWYRRVGNGGIPLLTLHGGPGAGHDYLEPLEVEPATRNGLFVMKSAACHSLPLRAAVTLY